MHDVAEPSAPLLPSGGLSAWRRPPGRSLYGNEFALRGSMGKSPRHIVRVARLIKANMPQRVTRVPEIYEHEAAFCHAPPTRSNLSLESQLLPPHDPLGLWPPDRRPGSSSRRRPASARRCLHGVVVLIDCPRRWGSVACFPYASPRHLLGSEHLQMIVIANELAARLKTPVKGRDVGDIQRQSALRTRPSKAAGR